MRRIDSARQAMALLALAAFPTGALAQAQPQQPAPEAPPVAAWRVECTGDGKVLECRAIQQIVQRETNQLVVSVVVRVPPGSKAPVMMMQLPLGLNLTEPVQIRVDSQPPERQPIQTCTNIGCFVAMTMTDKLVAAMRAGKELKITLHDVNKKSVDVALPLLGFSLAFDKAK